MFKFDLSEALGKFPHEIDEMPHEDFVAFLIKSQISPLKTKRDDILHSHMMWLTQAVNSDPKKFKKTPVDYQLFRSTEPAKAMTDEQLESAICITLSRA